MYDESRDRTEQEDPQGVFAADPTDSLAWFLARGDESFSQVRGTLIVIPCEEPAEGE